MGLLTELQMDQNQLTEALDTSKKAVALAHETGELWIEPIMRVHRGELLEKQLSLQAAEQEYRQAVELIEAMRGQLRNSEQRIQLQGSLSPPYEPLVRLLCGQTTNPRAICEAFSFAERARSRTLVELLSRTEIRPPTTLPSSLVAREAQLLEQLLQIEESENFGVELAQQHQQLNQELKKLWDDMELIDEDCRDYVALRRTPAVDIQAILELLRD